MLCSRETVSFSWRSKLAVLEAVHSCSLHR